MKMELPTPDSRGHTGAIKANLIMSLPTDIAESFRVLYSEEGVAYAKAFKPKESDVFITTFAKCGTNWVCQICHMLRSKGSMEWEDSNYLYPFDIMAKSLGMDLDMEQPFQPRLFKSHESLKNVAQGARYIHCMRDPKDAIISMYKMQLGIYRVTPEEYPFEVFEKYYVDPAETSKGFGDITQSYADSVKYYKENPDKVLWLYYDDMKKDPRAQVKRIAEFMGITDESLIDMATEKSSLEFMTKHKHKFGSKSLEGNAMRNMNPRVMAHIKERIKEAFTVVGKGVSGAGKSLPDSAVKILDGEWKRLLFDTYGYKDFQDLRAKLK